MNLRKNSACKKVDQPILYNTCRVFSGFNNLILIKTFDIHEQKIKLCQLKPPRYMKLISLGIQHVTCPSMFITIVEINTLP